MGRETKLKKAYDFLFSNFDQPVENFFNPRDKISKLTGVDVGTISKTFDVQKHDPDGYKLYKNLGNAQVKSKIKNQGLNLVDLDLDLERIKTEQRATETRKTKEDIGKKYASKDDLIDFRNIKNKKSQLNKYFMENPDAINNTEFGKEIKKQMDIRIAGKDMEWDGKKIKKGDIWFKTRPDKYYYDVAKSDKGLFHIFDVNPIEGAERFTRVPDNLNLATRDFNSGFVKQLNAFFKKDGKLHGNTESLKKVTALLDDYNIRVKIDDVGRIGTHEQVAVNRAEGTYPRITKTLERFRLPDELKNISREITSKVLTGWCSPGKQIVKKAGGGRIGFGGCSDGEKITNMKNAASKLKQHKLYLMGKATTTPFASNAAAKALALKMTKSGGLLMRAGRFVMGPATLWGEPLFEGAFIAHDILGTGTPWKEAVAKSLWAKPAISMGLLKPADQQYDEALWQVQNEEGEALMIDPYHERVRTPIKRFIDNNKKIDKLNKLFTLKQNSHIMGPRSFTQDERETKIKNADETYIDYLKSLGGAEGVRDIENQISEDQEAYDTRVAALEIERQGITEDDIFTPGGLKRPGVERDADIKQKQAEEDLMYQKYGKTRAKNVGIKGTPGEFKEKWITDPEFKSGIDEQLKSFGDYYGYGYTPYGLGYGMSNGKYNEDLGYKQLTEFMDYQNSMENIARAGGVANMATGGRAGYMGGGITAIRRPKAIPPERQGLRSILINGKKS